MAPDEIMVIRDGMEHTMPTSELAVRDIVPVRSREKIPSDTTVISGKSLVNKSMLTGESIPVDMGPEDALYGVMVNESGSLRARIEKTGEDAVLFQTARMMDIV